MGHIRQHHLVKAHVKKLLSHLCGVFAHGLVVSVQPEALLILIVHADLIFDGVGAGSGGQQIVNAAADLGRQIDVLLFHVCQEIFNGGGGFRRDGNAVIHRHLRLGFPHQLAAAGLHLQQQGIALVQAAHIFLQLVVVQIGVGHENGPHRFHIRPGHCLHAGVVRFFKHHIRIHRVKGLDLVSLAVKDRVLIRQDRQLDTDTVLVDHRVLLQAVEGDHPHRDDGQQHHKGDEEIVAPFAPAFIEYLYSCQNFTPLSWKCGAHAAHRWKRGCPGRCPQS